jgi:hypothetical protein
MNDLEGVLRSVRDRIARYRGQSIGEQNTKNVLIEPVLRALGWDVEDLEEVRREFKRKAPDNPVDYVLFLIRTPRLFVEAKALGENLSDDRWAKQIMGYATVAGVEWVVLTDGNEYRIFNSHAPVPVEEKLFRRVVIGADEPGTIETLALLSKGQLQDNQIEVLWKADYVDRQVKAAIDGLFMPEAAADFVRLLKKRVPALTPADVRASLTRVRLAVDYPVVQIPPSAARRAEPPPPAAGRRVVRRDEPPAAGSKTPWRNVTVNDLIAAGAIRPPLALVTTYKGHQLSARIEADGTVTWNGTRFESLSTAAGMARRSIVGAPPGREYPQTNGWTFWRYRRADDSLAFLDELRRELHEDKVVSLDLAKRVGA